MDLAAPFAGVVTKTGAFSKCGQSIYTEATPANEPTLLTSAAASISWYSGVSEYDYSTGAVKSGKDKAKSDLFTQLLWKDSHTVGFGISGKYVIAWYCDKGNTGTVDNYKKNVGTLCIPTTGDANHCYNERALKAANAKRLIHGSPALTNNLVTAKAIQALMDATGYTGGPVTKASAYASCNQIVYNYKAQTVKAASIVMTTNIAVDTWYKGKQFYDFDKGMVKYPADQTAIRALKVTDRTTKEKAILKETKVEQENFTQLIWRSSTRVGFGVKGDWVVAWFCDAAGNTTPAQNYVDNVNDVCVVKGYNRCYNKMALKFHNQKRALHKDTKFLALDAAIATKIQLEMDKPGFAGAISDKGSYGACGSSVFEQAISSKVAAVGTSNAASERWYAGESEYSYVNGAPKAAAVPAKAKAALSFTAMVWKSTTKVGFGFKGKWVIAWYCETEGNTGGAAQFKANVGAKCVQAGVNTCYTARALAAHNVRRGYHESKPLTLDVALTKQLQALMDDPAYAGKIAARPTAAAACGESTFEQVDPTKVATLSTSDDATAGWYAGKKHYDYAKGANKPLFNKVALTAAMTENAAQFTRMVWGSTTTVAFGIKGRWVTAWYCAVKGNTGGAAGYKTNVKKDCVKDGVDLCYVELALQAHNEKRARHRGGRPLVADLAASKHIQAVLNTETDFSGSISNKPNQFEDCGENVYLSKLTTPADLKKVKETNLATDAWYSGESEYNYSTGKPRSMNDAAKVKLSNEFANVVWSGTTKVGFGVKGKWVVAWYCETKATPADTVATLNNIGKQCKTKGINNCLNDAALKAHNSKRMIHDTKPFVWDKNLALILQKAMDFPPTFSFGAVVMPAA